MKKKNSLKRPHSMVIPVSQPIKVVNMDRETISSLSRKVRENTEEIEKLKEQIVILKELHSDY